MDTPWEQGMVPKCPALVRAVTSSYKQSPSLLLPNKYSSSNI